MKDNLFELDTEIRNEGRTAYHDGAKRIDNPHMFTNSTAAEYWYEGWDYASKFDAPIR